MDGKSQHNDFEQIFQKVQLFECLVVEGEIGGKTGILQLYRGQDFIITDARMTTVRDTPAWQHYNSPGWVEFNFIVKGSILQTQRGLYESRIIAQGSHSVLFNPDSLEENQLVENGEYRFISIYMPVSKAIELFEEYLPEFSYVARQLAAGKALFHQSPDNRFSERIARILNHLWEQPKQQQLKKLYFESLVNELFCLQWESMLHKPKESVGIKLREGDIEKLHYAAEILSQFYQQPPTLAQLAKKAQLNEYKLKAGFKQFFGVSVLNYIQHLRMEKAHQLIKETEKTMSEIAYELGYTHSQHFQRAFKKKFGIPPNSLRK
ncbi:helix-turn-helix domain-containing protein [Chitinophaga pendula]|uniref:helix-turn-helix domain-containing protein n=1 Tax=Chitinophaga TaxID=79328 RepID=UPI000BAFA3A1|nr:MULTISPECIES: helix-turn-helix domain-containing protein [Chitinophaga]ASZ13911.1 hypothetical protein CK934_24605 [Chitinophaga sp. MD30]UCJ08471.1 helix-turn-helix domain-containing protein [Chitinophaga pendula]